MKYANPYSHIREDSSQFEFIAVEKYLRGLGFEIGTGTNRLSPTVLGCDCFNHPDADMVWNCLDAPYPFKEERFDFVFSSHVIEDFAPEEIPKVFAEWFRLVKRGGYLVLLVPDMENKRYPDWNEVFAEDDIEVQKGQRAAGSLKGNPAHRCTMGLTLLKNITSKHENAKVVQADTLDHSQMTLDFVIQKL